MSWQETARHAWPSQYAQEQLVDELEAAAADAGVDPNGFALRDWFEMLAQADVRLERGAVPRLVDYCDAMDEDD